jgi:hypothetical protein
MIVTAGDVPTLNPSNQPIDPVAVAEFDAGTFAPGGSFPPLTISQARSVTRLYQQLLGRGPESTGLAYWTAQLASGVSFNAVVQAFLETPEYLDDVIATDYRTDLGREVDAAGLAYWQTQVAQYGLNPDAIPAKLLAAPEAYDEAGATTDGWLTMAYGRLFGREPDALGFSSSSETDTAVSKFRFGPGS